MDQSMSGLERKTWYSSMSTKLDQVTTDGDIIQKHYPLEYLFTVFTITDQL